MNRVRLIMSDGRFYKNMQCDKYHFFRKKMALFKSEIQRLRCACQFDRDEDGRQWE